MNEHGNQRAKNPKRTNSSTRCFQGEMTFCYFTITGPVYRELISNDDGNGNEKSVENITSFYLRCFAIFSTHSTCSIHRDLKIHRHVPTFSKNLEFGHFSGVVVALYCTKMIVQTTSLRAVKTGSYLVPYPQRNIGNLYNGRKEERNIVRTDVQAC